MKNKIFMMILITISLVLVGCQLQARQVVNNIINKEIDYGTITVKDLQDLVQETIQKVETSIIGIEFSERVGLTTTTSLGSGVIVNRVAVLKNPNLGEDASGNIETYHYLAITNRHVISTENNRIATNPEVYLGNIDEYTPATIEYYDNEVDIALISFDYPAKYIPVPFADSTTLRKGAFVIAIGNPSSFDYFGSATFGIVSHPLRYLDDETFNDSNVTHRNSYIQHDAAINAGNSGGGLFDIYGQLLGINTLKIIGQSNDIENMGFSIPSEEIQLVLKDYLP